LIQGTGIAFWLEGMRTPNGAALVPDPGWAFRALTVITLTTGTAFVMWLGEQISERGIGNGISLIIFAGIVVGLIPAIGATAERVQQGTMQPLVLIPLLVFMVFVVAFVVYMERAQRRIPVQYAKRVVGRKVYGGQSTYLPLRVNTGGVIPVIFASSVVTVPTVIAGFFQNEGVQRVANFFSYGQPIYYLLQVVTIVFFSYFYVSIIFNPQDLAENMRKYGGFIPGIRPGKRTAEYIDRILTRLTLVGALYLSAVTVLPEFLLTGFNVAGIPGVSPGFAGFFPRWFTEGLGIDFYFGGTSLLIVVGVAMDTIQQIESQLVMRNYEGFMKRGRIRGRRG
ncbi:MAG TPA: preprotein translocase subunit SecY, partial [Thermoanaerobaculia bacterium]|nr:preprotein translocase subunit SecY [Thermoanaerobaculia bacterium]